MLGEAIFLPSVSYEYDDGHCHPEGKDKHGQKCLEKEIFLRYFFMGKVSRLDIEYLITSTNAHHLLLAATLSRFLQIEPVLSIRQTIWSTINRQLPAMVV